MGKERRGGERRGEERRVNRRGELIGEESEEERSGKRRGESTTQQNIYKNKSFQFRLASAYAATISSARQDRLGALH